MGLTEDNWSVHDKLLPILHNIAGLPRQVSLIFDHMIHVEECVDPWKCYVDTLFSSSHGNPIDNRFDSGCKRLLAHAITGCPIQRAGIVEETGNNFQFYETNDIVFFRSSDSETFVSLPHWRVIINFHDNNNPLKAFTKLLHEQVQKRVSFFSLHHRDYELFNARHFIALIESFIIIGKNTITLEELFKGGVFSKGLQSVLKEDFDLCSQQYLEADHTDDLFKNHLHFKNQTTKAFDRKTQFKTKSGHVLEFFLQDRGMCNTQKSNYPDLLKSEVRTILQNLPSSNASKTNILVVVTTKFITDDLVKFVTKSDQNIIIIGNPSLASKMNISMYGIQHFYRDDLFALLFNVFIPKVLFIKNYMNQESSRNILRFSFLPFNQKQSLENLYKAIPLSSNLNDLIQNAGLQQRKDVLLQRLTDDPSESKQIGKILVDFSTLDHIEEETTEQ